MLHTFASNLSEILRPLKKKKKLYNIIIIIIITNFLYQSARNGIVSRNIGIFFLSRHTRIHTHARVHTSFTVHGELSRRQKFRYSLRGK